MDIAVCPGMGSKSVAIRGCEINCVNGHRVVNLFDKKGILWQSGDRNNLLMSF
jgi:hypothetical protein